MAGIDNTAESVHSRPPLTTVHIPKREMGILAFRRIEHLINSEEADIPVKTLVYCELIVRKSCGANLPSE